MDKLYKFIFLCLEENLHRESKSYFIELKKRFETTVLYPENFTKNKLKFDSLLAEKGQTLILIYPDAGKIFENIYLSPYQTVCFHIDTFVALHLRYGLAASFDINVVFHPRFKKKFEEQGFNNVIELSHAVELVNILDPAPLTDRNINIAFVGDLERSIYSKRKEIIDQVNRVYPVMGIGERMSIPQILNLYAQSRVVINISRDDYLEDANLRCFEAMGNRSLLFSYTPSELENLGFESRIHFIGIKSDEDWLSKIAAVLEDLDHFQIVADNGWQKTLASHTYTRMVDRFLEEMAKGIDISRKSKLKNYQRIYYGQVRYWTGHNHPFKAIKFALYFIYAGGRDLAIFTWIFKALSVSFLINLLGHKVYLKFKHLIKE